MFKIAFAFVFNFKNNIFDDKMYDFKYVLYNNVSIQTWQKLDRNECKTHKNAFADGLWGLYYIYISICISTYSWYLYIVKNRLGTFLIPKMAIIFQNNSKKIAKFLHFAKLLHYEL